jgi:hypothetical protein
MKGPAKRAFSSKYITYGICGALGSLDQGFSDGSDMARVCNTGGRDSGGGQAEGEEGRDRNKDLGAR